jgi:hypothetical protein
MGAQSAKRRFPARADRGGSMSYSGCLVESWKDCGGWFRWDEYSWNKFTDKFTDMHKNKFFQLELLDYDQQPADRRGPRPTAAGDRPTVQRDFMSNHQRVGFWRCWRRSASWRQLAPAPVGAAAPVTAPASAYCTRGDFGGERAYIEYLQYLHEHLRIGMRVRATEGFGCRGRGCRGDLGTFHDGPVLPGWVSALSVSHSKSVLYGVFAWARRAQNVGFRPGQIPTMGTSTGCFAGTSTAARVGISSASWSSSTTTSSRRTAVAHGPLESGIIGANGLRANGLRAELRRPARTARVGTLGVSERTVTGT